MIFQALDPIAIEKRLFDPLQHKVWGAREWVGRSPIYPDAAIPFERTFELPNRTLGAKAAVKCVEDPLEVCQHRGASFVACGERRFPKDFENSVLGEKGLDHRLVVRVVSDLEGSGIGKIAVDHVHVTISFAAGVVAAVTIVIGRAVWKGATFQPRSRNTTYLSSAGRMGSLMSEKGSGIFYGWWVVATCFLSLLFAGGALFYALPVFLKPLSAEFGWNRGDVSAGISATFIGQFFIAPLLGAITSRYGARVVMIPAAILAGLSLLLLTWLDHLLEFHALRVLMGIALVGLAFIPATVTIFRWFHTNRGRALGIALMAFPWAVSYLPLLPPVSLNDWGGNRHSRCSACPSG